MARRLRPGAAAALLALLASGCAASFIPSPEEVPRLEERVRQDRADVETLTRLGAAYQEADRLDEAASLLERARAEDPEDPNAAFFLGLVYEAQNRPAEAIRNLQDYLVLTPDSRFRGQADGRIRKLRRAELRLEVRRALEQESDLPTNPAPATVAVFPFRFAGDDPDLSPLGRAVAEMLVTDLSITDRLTVLERVRIQALLDEIALSEGAFTESGTAVRSGRLLGAGRVVQGQITGGERALRLEAAVVAVQDQATNTVSQEDALERIFEMEKALALQIYEEMGVALTVAERERVNERGTENLQALLAFGRGLDAQARGQYAEAQQHFARAVELDPGFRQAEQLEVEVEVVAEAESITVGEVAAQVAAAVTGSQVETQVQLVTQESADAATRDAAQEALGTEGVGQSLPTLLRLILRRPGGGQ